MVGRVPRAEPLGQVPPRDPGLGHEPDGVDEQALQQISTATGGHYYYAADEAQLSKIYSDLGSKIGWVTTKLDLTVPLLAFGTIILVAGGLFSLRWFRLLP